MSLQIQLKKSAVSQKQPFASDLAVGEIALNYNSDGPFLTCKDSAGNIRKLNNVWVGNTAPTGPSAGDLWLDTSGSTAVLKVYKDSNTAWSNATAVPIATTSVYGTVQLASTADIANATAGKVVDAAQLQSKITDGLAGDTLTFKGVNVLEDVTIGGDLTVNGTTTTVSSQTLLIEDKNIEMGVVDTPTDTTADGGGITLKGTTDKTINWVDATDSWTSSEHVDLASGKSYRINGIEVLSATALGSAVQITSANIPAGTIVDSDINASAEIAVSKLADGAARQLLQTDAAGTGVEWTDNVDIPGTLDVTGAATFDSSVAVIGALTKSGNDVVTVGDTGTVTSTMIADGTIVDGDISASAAIADTKLATIATAGKVSNSATTATDANTASAIVARDASGNFAAGTITADLAGNAATVTTNANLTGDITSVGNATSIAAGVIVDADVNASAAIAGTKISPDFGAQNVTTTGTSTAASFIPTSSTVPTNGVYLPAANSVALSTNGAGRLVIDASGNILTGPIGIGTANYSGSLVAQTTGDTYIAFRSGAANVSSREARIQAISTGAGGNGHSLAFLTNVSSGSPTERLRITSDGKVGLGTSSPGGRLELNTATVDNSTNYTATIWDSYALRVNQGNASIFSSGGASSSGDSYQLSFYGRYFNSGQGYQTNKGGYIRGGVVNGAAIGGQPIGEGILYLGTSTTNYSTIGVSDSDTVVIRNNRVGVGTTSPATTLDVNGDVTITDKIIHSGDTNTAIRFPANDTVSIETAGSERARIDSSGRLLVGTSTARSNFFNGTNTARVQIEGIGYETASAALICNSTLAGDAAIFSFHKSSTTALGSNALVTNNHLLGQINFNGSDGSEFVVAASVVAEVDGTPGTNDMPGRLVFSVTADGASSPTEALRISNNRAITVSDGGNVVLGTTTGTKIGTTTTQKLGFYNATPVVQPAAVADATAATVITQLNDLLAKLRTLGIIAT